MKIQPCSDLHVEMREHYHDYKLAITDADVIVLAGDIHIGIKAVLFAGKESIRQNKPVILIAGNHEFYHGDINVTLANMRTAAEDYPLLHFLENNELIIDGVRFLGCTLWTDYKGNGEDSQERYMTAITNALTDHSVIRNTYREFTTEDALAIHKCSRAWLEQKLKDDFKGKNVVVTHHGPSLKTQHLKFDYGLFSPAFLSDLDELVKKADIWIYGHSHSNIDVMIGNCWLLSNQAGYPSENMTPPINNELVVTVK